jgi:hypothetical protein
MTVRNNLGDKTTKKIERRLFEKFGISLTQGIEQFQKIDVVLREYFGAGADGLERKFLENICKVKTKNTANSWFTIKESIVTQTILESFGDDDRSSIINSVIENSKIISEILISCKIPQTSGYRKINQLIDNGLLIVDGFEVMSDDRKVCKYRSLFNNIRINIVKNKVTVDVQLETSHFNQSSVLKVILS